MDLKNFVADSIIQICEGIKLAQERTQTMGAYISPRMFNENQMAEKSLPSRASQKISFDVALEVTDEMCSKDNSNINGGLKIACFHISTETGNMDSQKGKETHISRIKFDIPVRWPVVVPKDEEYQEQIMPQRKYADDETLYGFRSNQF